LELIVPTPDDGTSDNNTEKHIDVDSEHLQALSDQLDAIQKEHINSRTTLVRAYDNCQHFARKCFFYFKYENEHVHDLNLNNVFNC